MKKDFKGFWIPAKIWLAKDLSPKEKLFLAEIDNLLDKNGNCKALNKHFAKFFNISERVCWGLIDSLKKKKYIEARTERGGFNNTEIKERIIRLIK